MATVLLVLARLGLAQPPAPDVNAIVRRSLETDQRNWQRLADYSYLESVETRILDGKGRIKKTESSTWDVLLLDGTPYRKRISRNGKPLDARDQAKAQADFDRERNKRLAESEGQRKRRLAKEAEERDRERAFTRQIPDAFEFHLEGEQAVAGEPVWVISSSPKPGFRPTVPHAEMLKNFRGRLFIGKRDYNWMRLEAEVLSTVGIGWVVARLKPGSRFMMEQQKMGDIWVPSHIEVEIDARVALVKGIRATARIERSQYRRFSTDSRIISMEESPKR